MENLCSFFGFALAFVDIGQFLRQSGAFVFHEDLRTIDSLGDLSDASYFARGDRSQRLDQLQLGVQVGRLLHEFVRFLHHLGDRLFQLTASLRQRVDVLVEKFPLFRCVAILDDGNENTTGGNGVGRLNEDEREG